MFCRFRCCCRVVVMVATRALLGVSVSGSSDRQRRSLIYRRHRATTGRHPWRHPSPRLSSRHSTFPHWLASPHRLHWQIVSRSRHTVVIAASRSAPQRQQRTMQPGLPYVSAAQISWNNDYYSTKFLHTKVAFSLCAWRRVNASWMLISNREPRGRGTDCSDWNYKEIRNSLYSHSQQEHSDSWFESNRFDSLSESIRI